MDSEESGMSNTGKNNSHDNFDSILETITVDGPTSFDYGSDESRLLYLAELAGRTELVVHWNHNTQRLTVKLADLEG